MHFPPPTNIKLTWLNIQILGLNPLPHAISQFTPPTSLATTQTPSNGFFPPHYLFLSWASTEHNALGIWFRGEHCRCHSIALHHHIYPRYLTIRAPTMPPAFYFYHGPVLSTMHSVFCFGVKIAAVAQLPFTTTFTLCISLYVPPPCPPPSISITGRYRAQRTQYLVLG